MLRAKDVADRIVKKCARDGNPVTNLKLQQLLYLAKTQGGELLRFADDTEAYPFGPCVPDVYYAYGHWGAMPIEPHDPTETDSLPEKAKARLDAVLDAYAGMMPWELHRIVCANGSPWEKAYRNGKGTVIGTEDEKGAI